MDDFGTQFWLPLAATFLGAVAGAFGAFQFERSKKRDDDRKAAAVAALQAIYTWLRVLDSVRWVPVTEWGERNPPSVSASREVSAHLQILRAQAESYDPRAERIWESWKIALRSKTRPRTHGIIGALSDFIADKDAGQIERRLAEDNVLNRQRASRRR